MSSNKNKGHTRDLLTALREDDGSEEESDEDDRRSGGRMRSMTIRAGEDESILVILLLRGGGLMRSMTIRAGEDDIIIIIIVNEVAA
jgi:hypothetical protein